MDSSQIGRILASRPGAALSLQALPSQGQLLSELLAALNKARPATGTRKASPQEIGEALKLTGDDLARFIPLVREATIGSDGKMSLLLREEFRFKPHPESDDLIISMALNATISPGKLEVADGLQAVVTFFVTTRVKVIEEATEEGKRGVRVVAKLGSRFYPI